MLGAFNRHFFLAIMVSSGAVLVLLRGANLGSSLVTGLFLVASTAAVFAFSNWRQFLFNQLDALFVIFAGSVAISFALNGRSGTLQETELLIISLAAYPACRLFPRGEFTPVFVWTISLIVAVGSIATVFALVEQWGDYLSKPVVFGYDHAATVFLLSLGFALIATASQQLDERRTKIVCALSFIPTFVFSVSMVRFVFVSLVVSLYVAARTSGAWRRRYIYTIIVMVVVATTAGLLTRYQTWATIGGYIISDARSAETPAWTPESQCGVIINDSLGVRRVLMRDAVQAIPSAGFFGLGFTNYKNVACFKMSPHNSILQAFVEFGWVGGIALTLLILTALVQLWPPARHSNEGRFVLCCLVYVALIDMAHGSISHTMLLFLFLGYAGRIYEDSFYRD